MTKKKPAPTSQVGKLRLCQAVTLKGSKCRSYAQSRSKYCYFHNPKLAANRKAAQSRGGRNGRAKHLPPETPAVNLKTAEDVRTLISETVSELRRGELDPKISTAIGYLATIALKSIEQGCLEERVRRIEETLSQGR